MNMKNEISSLSKLINPDIAIITNIGEAHIGNLGSKKISQLKSQILLMGCQKMELCCFHVIVTTLNYCKKKLLQKT